MSSASAHSGGAPVTGGSGKSNAKPRSSSSRSRLDAMDERCDDESDRRDDTEELTDGVNALEIKENFESIVGVGLSVSSVRFTLGWSGLSGPWLSGEMSTVCNTLNKLKEGASCAYKSYL